MDVFHIDPDIITSLHDISDEDLRSFAELHEDPANNDQVELYIYTCFLLFTRTHSTEYIGQAIQRTEGWIAELAINHPDRARRFRILDLMSAWMSHLSLISEDVELVLSGNSQASAYDEIDEQISRAARLAEKYERTGVLSILEEAIRITEQAINILPRPSALGNLAVMLGSRFERTGSMVDLNRAIDVADMAVNTTPQDDPNRAGRLSNLGSWLGRRFERTGSMDDLNRAVDVADMAVDATPQDHPDRVAILNNLGVWFSGRFKRIGSIDDLNRAVDIADMAVNAIPQDHPDQAVYLSNLGYQLDSRFERTGSVDDLNRAIDIADMAVNATPQDHPDRAGRLSNFGNWLGTRFERTGSVDDLNRAVDIADMAVNATPQDHPDRASRLNSLGSWLGRRFERTGSVDDLNRAVDVTDMAVNTTPQDHTDRAGRLSNLGSWLGTRFERTGSINDLNRAVNVMCMTINATPQDHPDRAGQLSNLGTWLGRRFKQTGSIDDLNRAVDIADMAVNATPQDDPYRAVYLNNLGNLFGSRFERTGSMDDLNRAVDVTDMAVNATPQDHPDRAGQLSNLGNWLGSRFERTGSIDDLNRALTSYKEGWRYYTAPPSIRIRLARRAAGILASRTNWEESSLLLQEAVNLLPTVSSRSLKHTDKQHMLAYFAGLASMAAATALNSGKEAYHALQLLELGRGVIASLLMEMRSDISDLQQQHPGLADEFTSLRDELDAPTDRASPIPTDNTLSWESQAKRRHEADQNFNELITRIRAQPGFHNFLLPPTAEELMAAADPDPIIVVNLSSYRCDAFLIKRDRIKMLELPGLTLKEVQKRARNLQLSRLTASSSPLLEWLWDVVARPSLDALGFRDPVSDDNWPRIWWVPIGLLSQLPLHAAGRHTLGSAETVLDRVMSSYASSVKALIYGRRLHIRKPASPPSDHALLVAMHETQGLSANGTLPFAAAEVGMLNDLCPSLQLKPIIPTPRKDDILKHLQACRIFHFAGHGQSDPTEPSQSCLLLEDWKSNPLTVGDLRDRRLQENPPFLGYLSACSTGANEAARLADEGIHLVSALQLAGFRHVVGTLWEVSDRHCVNVARVLYETLRDEGMTDIAVCRGLHRAIRGLRDGNNGAGLMRRESDPAGEVDENYDKTEVVETGNNDDEVAEECNRSATCQIHLQAGAEGGAQTPIRIREGRDPGQVRRRKRQDMFWVPYIHFGV